MLKSPRQTASQATITKLMLQQRVQFLFLRLELNKETKELKPKSHQKPNVPFVKCFKRLYIRG